VKQPQSEAHLLTTLRFSHEDILCKGPCRIVLPCGHSCIEECGDLCRCACDIGPPLEVVTCQLKDELWQQSLDDVLSDSPTKSWHASQKTAPDQSNAPGTSASSSAESSPRKWREWDAGKADKTLREIQTASGLPTAGATINSLLFVETHREVAIRNGARVKVANVGTVKSKGSISNRDHNVSQQPGRNGKCPAKPVKVGNDNKAANNPNSQSGTRFKYAGSMAQRKIPPYRLKSPPISLLQSLSAHRPTTIPPDCLADQAVPASPNMVPHRHHFEAIHEVASNVSLDGIIQKTPFSKIFLESITENSTNNEGDLISFE
jgi:hypothetical protein